MVTLFRSSAKVYPVARRKFGSPFCIALKTISGSYMKSCTEGRRVVML